jgi:hypothetical protein
MSISKLSAATILVPSSSVLVLLLEVELLLAVPLVVVVSLLIAVPFVVTFEAFI